MLLLPFGATTLYALSKERKEILLDVDYSVLIFFAAMFVFTSGLWSSGLVHVIISHIPNPAPVGNDLLQTNAIISAISIDYESNTKQCSICSPIYSCDV